MKRKLFKNKLFMFILIFLIIFVISGLVSTIDKFEFLINYDAITIMFYALMNSFLDIMSLLAPIIIFIVAGYDFHKILKTGNIKYKLTRENYKKFLTKNILKAYARSTILVLAMIVLFAGCCFINSKFNFDNAIPKPTGEYIMGQPVYIGTASMINVNFYSTPIYLMFTFFTVILLHSLFYANISLIMCKKNKNFIVSIISSFLVFMFICILSALIDSYLVQGFNTTALNGVFNLLGIWIYSDYTNLLCIILYSLFIFIISFILLLFVYRSKEEVLIHCEK